ncbi:FEL protein, partial [Amia calva]|nr:FEL protein [Amia calva]
MKPASFPGCHPTDKEVFLCRVLEQRLMQIDAGAGKVYGLQFNNKILKYNGRCWSSVEGRLKHITVGPGGVWGVDATNRIYQLVNKKWVTVKGHLQQIDAGGTDFVTGANVCSNVFCMNTKRGSTKQKMHKLPWTKIPGKMKYYSCGPHSCWGVNKDSNVFIRTGVSENNCGGSGDLFTVSGEMMKVEVGTDGTVFGLSTTGTVYQRHGTSPSNPKGDYWIRLHAVEAMRSLSYDQGILWLVSQNGHVRRCTKGSLSFSFPGSLSGRGV